MKPYSNTYEIRWSDLDANGHVNYAAYIDAAGDLRYRFFIEHGFPPEKFAEMGVGPVYSMIHANFFREVRMGETVTITYALSGLSHSGARWRVHHEVLKANWKKAVRVPTILEEIRAAAPGVMVLHAHGCDVLDPDTSGIDEAVRLAQAADVVVLVLGDRSGLLPDCTTGETRDSVDLRLPGVQNELARATCATGKPVVVVLVNGRPLAIPELAENASAILEAWLPGEAGGAAVADVLFGDVNPGGRLPVTFPRHVGQVPLFYNQKPSGGRSNWYQNYVSEACSPLFPFGHGLSYTTFQYTDFSLHPRQVKAGGSVDVSLTLLNSGAMAGDEVVQLYTCDEYGCVPRPVMELKGFTRLNLLPGEKRRITFHLPVNQQAFHDEEMRLVVEAGTIRVMVGASSADIRCEGSFEIAGEQKTPVKDRLFACPVDIT